MRPLNPLSIILDQNRLTDPNFIDWLRNLKVILAYKKILYVLNQCPPDPFLENIFQKEYDTLEKWKNDDMQAHCIMWASMSNEFIYNLRST